MLWSREPNQSAILCSHTANHAIMNLHCIVLVGRSKEFSIKVCCMLIIQHCQLCCVIHTAQKILLIHSRNKPTINIFINNITIVFSHSMFPRVVLVMEVHRLQD